LIRRPRPCALTYRTIIKKYPEAKIIDMTATPYRKDGRGLGNIFEMMIECPQVWRLIEQGFCAEPTRFDWRACQAGRLRRA
jgi:superfamily II DNA or RNA helicase